MISSVNVRLMLCCLTVFALLMPMSLLADVAPTTRPLPQNSKAESWLAIQRDGRAASANMQTATPAERELAYQRWLDSFSHPIPEFYDQEAGGEMSTGSGN